MALDAFSETIQNLPPIPWEVPVAQNCYLAMSGIANAAKNAFRFTSRIPFKPYTSVVTLTIIGFRKYIHSTMRKSLRQFNSIPWPLFNWGLSVALKEFDDTSTLGFL